ncbi:hypothetical protein [Sphingobium yanoikuyae]|uniref:hypothetical protein n=1 Tax=Sphingobium yanoikuyae TaxID=13690 RepID=UPI00131F04A5|nr:hypothetical protein [Sphingobium yanoikuyae]
MWIMTAGAAAAAGLAVTTALMLPGPQATGQSGAQSSSFNSDNCEETVPRTSGQAAFPTAEGFGRFAKGGRGGVVYLVTSLDDKGPGTLRECAEASGPRTCVFRVSGTIVVDDWIKVMQPYLTIAGQTSPGASPSASAIRSIHRCWCRRMMSSSATSACVPAHRPKRRIMSIRSRSAALPMT